MIGRRLCNAIRFIRIAATVNVLECTWPIDDESRPGLYAPAACLHRLFAYRDRNFSSIGVRACAIRLAAFVAGVPMVIVGVFGWILTGIIVGFIVSKVVNLRGDDPKLGIAVGAIAGLIGGIGYTVKSGAGVVGFNLWCIITAATCSLIAVIAWHLVRSRSVSREQQSIRRSY